MNYGYDTLERPDRSALYARVWVEVGGRRVPLHETGYRKALAQVRQDAEKCIAAIKRACK
jgi:hypothetical protein